MGKVKEYLKDRLTVILIFLFLVFIWPTPFEWGKGYKYKVWRFTGTQVPWGERPKPQEPPMTEQEMQKRVQELLDSIK